MPSVRAWLVHDRRTGEAAASLHVHPNTLAYRVRRFEELSGRSLQSTAGLAEVWLALQAAWTTGRAEAVRPADTGCHPALPWVPRTAMTVTDELPRQHTALRRDLRQGACPCRRAKHVAVVACMDARLNVYGLLGLE